VRAAATLLGVRAGDEIAPLARTVTQAQIDAYAEASGDRNPLHVDDAFAREHGFVGCIAHGLLTTAILVEAVARWAGGFDSVASVAVRFSRPLLRGDTITCTGQVTAVDAAAGTVSLAVAAVSQRGERVLSNGRAQVRLPRD